MAGSGKGKIRFPGSLPAGRGHTMGAGKGQGEALPQRVLPAFCILTGGPRKAEARQLGLLRPSFKDAKGTLQAPHTNLLVPQKLPVSETKFLWWIPPNW